MRAPWLAQSPRIPRAKIMLRKSASRQSHRSNCDTPTDSRKRSHPLPPAARFSTIPRPSSSGAAVRYAITSVTFAPGLPQRTRADAHPRDRCAAHSTCDRRCDPRSSWASASPLLFSQRNPPCNPFRRCLRGRRANRRDNASARSQRFHIDAKFTAPLGKNRTAFWLRNRIASNPSRSRELPHPALANPRAAQIPQWAK